MTTQLMTRTLPKKVTSCPERGRSSDFRYVHRVAFSWVPRASRRIERSLRNGSKRMRYLMGISHRIGYSGRAVSEFHRSSLFTCGPQGRTSPRAVGAGNLATGVSSVKPRDEVPYARCRCGVGTPQFGSFKIPSVHSMCGEPPNPQGHHVDALPTRFACETRLDATP